MSCTRHFLNFEWEHHAWHRRVTGAENVAAQETNMWGRVVHRQAVRCDKADVCEACGQTRRAVSCVCDTAHADRCAILQAWINRSYQAAEGDAPAHTLGSMS